MGDNVIPLADVRHSGRLPEVPSVLTAPNGRLLDGLQRPLQDLRISVTDRCNFRCSYCMPKEVFDKNYKFLPQPSLLTFEEITRIANIFAGHGVRKLRLTGGEPLLRKHVEELIRQLSNLRTHDGQPMDLTLTTNGSLLERKAKDLAQAGLRRVTVSLDALDDAVFRRMNDVDFPVESVLRGIDAALDAGLSPVKVNMVVKRGVNDQEVIPMADYFRKRHGSHVALRFIEFMDVGSTNGWRMEHVVPSQELIDRLSRHFPMDRLPPTDPGETAQRWAYRDNGAEVGFISSVSQPFCGACNRARLSTEGQLYLCLFASQGMDLRTLLRGSFSDAQISSALAQIWSSRQDRYSELRHLQQAEPHSGARRIEMHYIGG
jgi:GTP 3',8-cyclase